MVVYLTVSRNYKFVTLISEFPLATVSSPFHPSSRSFLRHVTGYFIMEAQLHQTHRVGTLPTWPSATFQYICISSPFWKLSASSKTHISVMSVILILKLFSEKLQDRLFLLRLSSHSSNTCGSGFWQQVAFKSRCVYNMLIWFLLTWSVDSECYWRCIPVVFNRGMEQVQIKPQDGI
jgi:hypothetical protein